VSKHRQAKEDKTVDKKEGATLGRKVLNSLGVHNQYHYWPEKAAMFGE